MKTKLTIITFAILISISTNLFSKENKFLIISLEKVSKYKNDRIAFQLINKSVTPFLDDSIESLLIIKNRKMYLIKDGYDNAQDIQSKKHVLDAKNKFYTIGTLWPNKINGKPDYIKTSERRQILSTNDNEEFVNKNFGPYYKTVRDNFIKRHVEIFRQLMGNRGESKLQVEIKPIKRRVYDNSKKKYSISAIAKTYDDTMYYCEDSDGDGITDTFTVSRKDGFDWGIKSGPNIVFIFNNKNKDLETMIGKLASEAVHGNMDDEKKIIQSVPKEKEINDLIKWIAPNIKW